LWRCFARIGGSIDRLTLAVPTTCFGDGNNMHQKKYAPLAAQLGEDSPGERVAASVSV